MRINGAMAIVDRRGVSGDFGPSALIGIPRAEYHAASGLIDSDRTTATGFGRIAQSAGSYRYLW
jgi:hypothetical protein